MRNLNLDQLQTLIAIADLGTLAAAAHALHLAPPTISLHLKELEQRFDTPLLIRSKKPAQLTQAGELLVEEGRKLLSASDDLQQVIQRHAKGCVGLVRVGLSAGVNTYLLPQALRLLSQQAPEVEIRLEALGSTAALERIHAGSLDIGIVASSHVAAAPSIQIEAWRHDTIVALVPISWNVPEFVTPQWLAQRKWSSFAPSTQMHSLITGWFGHAGLNPRPYLSLSYPGALKEMTIASQSAALLPLDEVQELKHSAEVLIRPLKPSLLRPMGLAFRSSHEPLPLAIQSVLNVLRQFAVHSDATDCHISALPQGPSDL